MKKKNKTLYMILPCYNEEEVIHETAKRLKIKFNHLIKKNNISDQSKIVFVNDGSKDDTWSIINQLHQEDKIFSGLNLSRNCGHQNALLAGLMTVKNLCDFTISMDVDLQDDIDAIDEMIDKYNMGSHIVYGVRDNRKADTGFKRNTATLYYKILKSFGSDSIPNHADFRLMSQRALNGLAEFKEVNLFLRGLVPMIGYESDIVYYKRSKRFAGESKYPFKKMLAFAIEGITSLSVKPLKLISRVGIISFALSIIFAIYFIIQHFLGQTISGWSSTIVSIWAIGGLQLLALGIIGEYIGKIFLETKERPRYIIQDFLNEKQTPLLGDDEQSKS